ncbi:hypothetical protein O53_5263 [Microcystis aeruginosa TAIHU98]|uniref:Uncharacterized protein n=1 Tax=Microcystis aeruginosa TAIHU98 TaxID=1134457 RepID=L7E107_MICAE|nr:hypothetical protein O53_5263 [Microcystis aeruginosa TAIHU98]ODV37813.1 hypothetical protein BFG60_2785 [Microcystis aeruginosa NIES-98]CCI32449.1 hypothetical protein MICAI_2580014 [Microcystis sp. T1-4]
MRTRESGLSLSKLMNLTADSEEIFPTPHTPHPTPSLDFNLVVTPSVEKL